MDGFGGFLGKHITVKCEVCEAEKDILKDTIISAIERRVATKPQNCRHTEDIEDESFESEGKEDLRHTALMRPKQSSYKVQAHPVRSNLLSIVPVEDQPEEIEDKSFESEDKEDLRHTIRASNVYSLNQRITSNDNFHENRIKIDEMNEAFEDDKDLDLRNQLRVSGSYRCQKKQRRSDDLREKIQGNTIKKLKEQLEISHQSQIQMEKENKKEMQELRKKCEKEKKELGQMQLKNFRTREEKIEVDLRQSQTQLKELNVKYEQQSNKYEIQLQKLREQFEMEKKKEIQDWKEKYERQSKVLKNYKLQLLERRFLHQIENSDTFWQLWFSI